MSKNKSVHIEVQYCQQEERLDFVLNSAGIDYFVSVLKDIGSFDNSDKNILKLSNLIEYDHRSDCVPIVQVILSNVLDDFRGDTLNNLSKEQFMLVQVVNGKQQVKVTINNASIDNLICSLQYLQSLDQPEHIHFMSPCWGGTSLSEGPGLLGHTVIQHLKIYKW